MPRPERKLPPVYLCETGSDGASCRLKWLASTCLAGMVGVCLIGVAIYASMNAFISSGNEIFIVVMELSPPNYVNSVPCMAIFAKENRFSSFPKSLSAIWTPFL